MIKLLVTTAVVLCTLGTVNAAELTPDQVPADPNLARLMFDPQSIAEWDQTKARQWYWAQYRAKHPLTTADREAAPIGLVGEPFPPGNEQVAQGGIGSDYVAQARVDRAQNCPQPTAEADARDCSGQQRVAVPLPRPNPLKAYAKAPQGTQGTEAAKENEAAGRPFWKLEE